MSRRTKASLQAIMTLASKQKLCTTVIELNLRLMSTSPPGIDVKLRGLLNPACMTQKLS